jgi:membrane associated rhomboid family serine protease
MGSYPRTPGIRFSWGGLLTPAIKALLIANAGVFLLQTLLMLFSKPAYGLFLGWFGLIPLAATRGLRIWQPFTYLFLHGTLWHLLINMLVLWMFGADLERQWGQRKFYFYYFLTGAGAGLINIVVKMAFFAPGSPEQMAVTIGASGAVYGILLAAALVFPDRQVWLIPFPVMLPMRVYVAIMGAIAFFGSLGASGDNISHISHLGGMLVGYLYLRRGSFLYRLRNRYSDWQRQRTRRKFEVYQREHRDDPPRRPDDWVN